MTRLPVFKMDVEGAEWKVFHDLKSYNTITDVFPDQILVEIHSFTYFVNPFEVWDIDDKWIPRKGNGAACKGYHNYFGLVHSFVGALDTMGYRVAMKEENPLCPPCHEFSLVRPVR